MSGSASKKEPYCPFCRCRIKLLDGIIICEYCEKIIDFDYFKYDQPAEPLMK